MSEIIDAFALFGDAPARDDPRHERVAAATDYAVYEQLNGFYADVYAPLCDRSLETGAKLLYVPTLDLPDKTLDTLIEYAFDNDARLAVSCCSTLTEAGRIDARFNKSAVMLLHEFGLLERSTVLSGVYLDKDDLSLMAQENVPLVVFPSSDAGHGNGVAPICSALDKGVRVSIGSGDGAFNRKRDIIREAWTLGLLVCSQMNDGEAVDRLTLAGMCLSDDATPSELKNTARRISEI